MSHRHRSNSADADNLVGRRLSLAGFQPAGVLSRQSSRPTSSNDDALLDELHSDPYSLVIEKLRLQLRDCLPAIDEEMISKAVINAFSTYPSSDDAELYTDKLQIEVELLCEAHQWILQHLGATDEYAQQEFLQKCLDKVFLQIRRENLASSSRALRIILNVCTILGLEIDDSVHVPNDTVLLQGLPRTATRKALYESLSTFGPVNAFAISTEFSGFAFCRFDDEASAHRVVKDRNAIAFGGSLIGATMLGEITLFCEPRRKFGAAKDIEIIPGCVSKHTARSSIDQQDAVFATDNYSPLSFIS
jgi:transcriptional regulator of met regulon